MSHFLGLELGFRVLNSLRINLLFYLKAIFKLIINWVLKFVIQEEIISNQVVNTLQMTLKDCEVGRIVAAEGCVVVINQWEQTDGCNDWFAQLNPDVDTPM